MDFLQYVMSQADEIWHINIIKGDMTDKAWNEDLSKGLERFLN